MLENAWKGVKRRCRRTTLAPSPIGSWFTPYRLRYQIWIEPSWITLDARTSAIVHQRLKLGSNKVIIQRDSRLAIHFHVQQHSTAAQLEIRCRPPPAAPDLAQQQQLLPVRCRRWWRTRPLSNLVAVLPTLPNPGATRDLPSKESTLIFFSHAPSLLVDAGSSTLSFSEDYRQHPSCLDALALKRRSLGQEAPNLPTCIESVLV